ncbi:MAG: hypothetical protein KAS23_01630 [Anaerohalosphaera sp.]|nr:hypothetical protein [Anaerohalosphaera sp.]
MFNMFEGPWLLLCVAVGTWMGLVIAANNGVEVGRIWQILIPLVIIGCAFAVDHFVKTDMEKIEAVVAELVEATEEQSPQRIEQLISSSYSDGFHQSKDQLMRTCRKALAKPLADKIITRFITINITERRAKGEFSFLVNLDQHSPYASLVGVAKVKVQVDFAKEASGDWFVRSSELCEVNNQRVSWRAVR